MIKKNQFKTDNERKIKYKYGMDTNSDADYRQSFLLKLTEWKKTKNKK